MRRNCWYRGEGMYIKTDKVNYGGMYVPSADEKRDKVDRTVSKPSGLDALRDEIERMKDELAKRNRDQLDAMYNLDLDNFSGDVKRLFASWTDGIKSANASISAVADETNAVLEAQTKFETDMTTAYNSFVQQANATYATQSMLSEYVDKNTLASTKSELELYADNAASSAVLNANFATQNDISSSEATIKAYVEKNYATTSMISKVVDSEGDIKVASIITEINNDESSVRISADKIEFEGDASFVTKSDLATSGATTINGNNIELDLQFATGSSGVRVSEASLGFTYMKGQVGERFGVENEMGNIHTKYDGADTDSEAKFALVFETNQIGAWNRDTDITDWDDVDKYNVALKLIASGSMSMKSEEGDIFFNSRYKRIRLEGFSGVRIFADKTHEIITSSAHGGSYDANAYIFASDGIYYNGKCLVPTSGIIIS